MQHRKSRSRQASADAARLAEAAEFLDLLEADLATLIDDLKEARRLLLDLGALAPSDLGPIVARIEARIVALRHVQANT